MPGEGTVNIMLEDNPKGGFHQAQQGAGRPNAGRAKCAKLPNCLSDRLALTGPYLKPDEGAR